MKNESPRMAIVRRVQGEMSGHLIRSRLSWAGIPSILLYDTYFNYYTGAYNPVSIAVPRRYLAAARKLVGEPEWNLVETIPPGKRRLFSICYLLATVI